MSTPNYLLRQKGSGPGAVISVIDKANDALLFEFVCTDQAKKKSGPAGCIAMGCLGVILTIVTESGDLDFGSDVSSNHTNWELRRPDGSVVFLFRKIRRGYDVFDGNESVGRIEWKKLKKIVEHEVILNDKLIATAVPDGLLRNEVRLEIPAGILAVLRQTKSFNTASLAEVYIRRELPEEEIAMVFGVALQWV